MNNLSVPVSYKFKVSEIKPLHSNKLICRVDSFLISDGVDIVMNTGFLRSIFWKDIDKFNSDYEEMLSEVDSKLRDYTESVLGKEYKSYTVLGKGNYMEVISTYRGSSYDELSI